MKIATSFILIFCIFFGTQSTCAQNADVDSINIISQWGGLGKPSRHYLFLKEKKGRLYKGRKRINAKLIETIFGELNPVAKLRLSDFGIDQEWLTANAKEANMYSFLYSDEQNSLFYKSFTDTELIKSIFPSLFRCYWSDDSPYLKMEIIKKDFENFARMRPHYSEIKKVIKLQDA